MRATGASWWPQAVASSKVVADARSERSVGGFRGRFELRIEMLFLAKKKQWLVKDGDVNMTLEREIGDKVGHCRLSLSLIRASFL